MPSYSTENLSNNSKRATRIYKDLDLDFGRNTVTNDVNKLTDVEAVKRSVRNLINTNHFERPFHPEIGGNVRALLFENTDDPLLDSLIQSRIEAAIENFEPRAKVDRVVVDVKPDSNALVIKIRFTILNERFPVDLEVAIERVR